MVTFDKPLIDPGVPLAAGNWLLHLQFSGTVPANSAEVAPPNQVALTFAETLAAQSIQYLAAPADVIGAPPNNLPVQAFTWPL